MPRLFFVRNKRQMKVQNKSSVSKKTSAGDTSTCHPLKLLLSLFLLLLFHKFDDFGAYFAFEFSEINAFYETGSANSGDTFLCGNFDS